MYQIHIASPEAKAFMPADFEASNDGYRPMIEAQSKASKYPFARMQVGHCFVIPYGDAKEAAANQLRKAICVAQANPKLKPRMWKLLRHDDLNLFEVARIQ